MPVMQNTSIYRLDIFTLPQQARTEILEVVQQIHRVLRMQPGFVRDFIVEKADAQGVATIVTCVEWQGREFVAGAAQAVAAHHKQTGFDKQEFLRRTGAVADMGTYWAVQTSEAESEASA